MRETWQYYGYLQRWWWVLLAGTLVGSALGLAFYINGAQPLEYNSTATIGIQEVVVTLDSGAKVTKEAAVNSMTKQIQLLDELTTIPLMIHTRVVDESAVRASWRDCILGAVFGLLFTIGAIHIWEDIRKYRSSQY